MKIQVIDPRLAEHFRLPNPGNAGIDMHACINATTAIHPGQVVGILAGFKVAIPDGFVGLLVPRSGTGSRGLHLANATGVIDSSYRGEVMMKVINRSDSPINISPMDRIAQMVVIPHFTYRDNTYFVEELDKTARGESGFGSTGK